MATRILELIDKVPEFLKGVLVWAIGPLDIQLSYLGLVMLFDLILAVWVAAKEGKFRFKTMVSKTIEKVAVYAMILGIFHALGAVSHLPSPVRWAAIFTLVIRDGMSALKNIGRLGYSPLARSLEEIFMKFAHKEKEDGDHDDEVSS